eukprot:TRINITY_DN69125_c0_g1_i1.p1 TRINITY_DN69125_c0_g1~~TRINITY_DN69125_c0_g1_i1.p1  ORF type:complete len:227 (+),score=15.02 TRINITY_DN69125_c0_g1_i1:106-786(+)
MSGLNSVGPAPPSSDTNTPSLPHPSLSPDAVRARYEDPIDEGLSARHEPSSVSRSDYDGSFLRRRSAGLSAPSHNARTTAAGGQGGLASAGYGGSGSGGGLGVPPGMMPQLPSGALGIMSFVFSTLFGNLPLVMFLLRNGAAFVVGVIFTLLLVCLFWGPTGFAAAIAPHFGITLILLAILALTCQMQHGWRPLQQRREQKKAHAEAKRTISVAQKELLTRAPDLD